MFHVIGVTLVLIALLAVAGGAAFVAVRLVQFARAGKALRRHPIFEADWRAHQQETVQRIRAGGAELKEDIGSLAAAIARLALALDELGALAYGSSRPIERILRIGLPWLAGLLRAPEGR